MPVFSCEFCETFEKTFFYRTPPVAAPVLSLTALTIAIVFVIELFLAVLDIF